MLNYRLICIAILVFICAGCGKDISSHERTAAIEKADAWLTLVDSGEYKASWRAAADYLKGNVDEQKWVQTMTTVRKPMGALLARKIKSTQYRTMMPHSLKGKYLIIDYKSSFSNKKAVVESITQMMEKDGNWRVAGYHTDAAY